MSEYEQYGIQSNIINMSTFKTLKATLENLDLSALQARLKTVEADIENLEDELAKRFDIKETRSFYWTLA
jgi:hypothetical protein